MHTDPRLLSLELLTLAALRAKRRHQVPAWQQSEGLASLLAAAKSLPPRDPWDLPDVEERRGLGRLLAEARQWPKPL